MTDIKIVIGANFGDEGKGLFVDKFSNDAITKNNSCIVIMSNGGSQRGHTVNLINNISHTFKHFSAGTFAGADTYFPSYFILNPMQFIKEYNELNDKYFIKPNVYSDYNCMWTTPYDMMINQIIEEAREDKKHGSCGMGIWETVYRYSCNIIPSIFDFNKYTFEQKINLLKNWRDNYFVHRLNELGVKSIPDNWKTIYYDNNILIHFISDVEQMLKIIIYKDISYIKSYKSIIFENGQGLLLDGNNKFYGDNTTPSKTGCANSFNIINSLFTSNEADIELCYITRTYMTRHGAGRFETECDKSIINNSINDEVNIENEFQGKLRYGELNIDGLNTRINDNSKLFYNNKYNVKTSIGVTHTNENYLDLSKLHCDGNIYTSDTRTRESVKIERI